MLENGYFTYPQWFQEAKKKLSTRINRLDSSLDECAALTENTRVEVIKNYGSHGFGFILVFNKKKRLTQF